MHCTMITVSPVDARHRHRTQFHSFSLLMRIFKILSLGHVVVLTAVSALCVTAWGPHFALLTLFVHVAQPPPQQPPVCFLYSRPHLLFV